MMQKVHTLPAARIILGVAVGLILLGAIFEVRYLLTPSVGLVVNYPEAVERDGVVVFSPRVPFSPAVRAGLVAGQDVLIAVDGRPVRTLRDLIELDRVPRGADTVSVTVERATGRTEVEIRPILGVQRWDWIFTALFVGSLAGAAIYLLVVFPHRGYAIPLSLASVFYLVFTCVKPFYYESMATNVLIHLGRFSPWLLVLFALQFPRPRGKGWQRVLLWLALGTCVAAFTVVRLVCFSRWARTGAIEWYEFYRALGRGANGAEAVAYLSFAGIMIHRYSQSSRSGVRGPIEWFLGGAVVGLFPYFFLDQLPMILESSGGPRVSLGNISPLFLVALPVSVVLGLSRERRSNLYRPIRRRLLGIVFGVFTVGVLSAAYGPVTGWLSSRYGLAPAHAGLLACVGLWVVLLGLRALVQGRLQALKSRIQDPEEGSSETDLRARMSAQSEKRSELESMARGLRTGVVRPLSKALEGDIRSRREIWSVAHRSLGVMDRFVTLFGHRVDVRTEVEGVHLCRRAIASVSRSWPGARMELCVERPWSATCNAREMIRAIGEIVSNAVEAEGPSPAVSVTLGVVQSTRYIEIQDHGRGMNALQRRKSVMPLYTTKAGHAGLGLFFARMAVEREGGRLHVHSQPQGGTSVRIELDCCP